MMGKKERSALQIGKKSFLTAFFILFTLMIFAGILTQVVPGGVYDRTKEGARTLVVPGSYRETARPDYPAWRWFTAPVEVLWGQDSPVVITIIAFLLFIGGAYAVVEKGEVLKHILDLFVEKFRHRKYLLMAAVMFFFALCGGVLGIYEEVVPLIVFVVPLALALGWDSLTGLGMSLLALAFGFSSSVTNPFTVGVAQTIAGLPLYSGALLRTVFFLVTYAVVFLFVFRYARAVERDPSRSLVRSEDLAAMARHAEMLAAGGGAKPSGAADAHSLGAAATHEADAGRAAGMRKATAWLSVWIGLALAFIIAVMALRSLAPVLSTIAFPVVGLLFTVAGLGAGFFVGMGVKGAVSAFRAGVVTILPAVVLILLAMSVKQIITSGGIMDTILKAVSGAVSGAPKYLAAFLVYVSTLVLEFFIGSASAKAFLMMPILSPLADLVGITRQTTVLAYGIGDGFVNMFYPTNGILLIALGLTVVGYPKWIRWTLPLQGIMFLVSMAFIAFSVAINWGPF